MRVAEWERRLKLVTQKHMALPSEYGVSDCFIIADDAVEAVTGVRMYAGTMNYKTAKGAARKIRKHGFKTVEEAFASKFPEIHPALAQRGDIGVVYRAGEHSGGVFTGIGFMTRDANNVVFLPASEVKTAFKVD